MKEIIYIELSQKALKISWADQDNLLQLGSLHDFKKAA